MPQQLYQCIIEQTSERGEERRGEERRGEERRGEERRGEERRGEEGGGEKYKILEEKRQRKANVERYTLGLTVLEGLRE